LVNLIGNAIKFTERGKVAVTIQARLLKSAQTSPSALPSQYALRIAVQDTGIGIASERLHRLFHPFSQVDASSTRQYGGTGLGLAISRRLSEMMQGRIWVESEVGLGSTFYTAILTTACVESGTATAPHQLQPKVVSANKPTSPAQNNSIPQLAEQYPLRILLAEDNVVNQKVALQLLQRMGYQADVAENGLEAIAALRRQPYDIILMDMQMPEMDGLAATQAICQEWSADQRPRIIAMTANAMQGDRDRCLAAGMDDYLSKPIRAEQLAHALSQWRPQPVASASHSSESSLLSEPVVDATLTELTEITELIKAIALAILAQDAGGLEQAAASLKELSVEQDAMSLASLSQDLEALGHAKTVTEAAALMPQLYAEYQQLKNERQIISAPY